MQEEKITIDEEEYFDNLNQLVEVGEEFYHDEMVLSWWFGEIVAKSLLQL